MEANVKERWKAGIRFWMLLAAMVPPAMHPQSSTNYSIENSVVDQGGTFSTSPGYQVIDAVGQSVMAGTSAGPLYIETSGFFAIVGVASGVAGEDGTTIPLEFELVQNYPNPFNPETCIEYRLPSAAEVSIGIYDVQGHEIRRLLRGVQSAGCFKTVWDGCDESGRRAPSGIYFCRIGIAHRQGGKADFRVKKMTLLK